MRLEIIVTGSRFWSDSEHGQTVQDALVWALGAYTTIGTPVLKHGASPEGGVDWIADRIWRDLGLVIPLSDPILFEVKDYPSFRARNQAMVDSGATVCLAFADRWASGTGQTARMARRAGIPVKDYGVNTA